VLSPLSFTPELRKKLSELPRASRREWLESIVRELERTMSTTPPPHGARPQAELFAELAEVSRACRAVMVRDIEHQHGPFAPSHLRALVDVSRERFVRFADLARSSDDTPLPLDDDGQATISAPHAYVLSFRLLELGPGDSLLELGSGSGYGAALASTIVGGDGSVVTVEIDARLYDWASARLRDQPSVQVLHGDAVTAAANIVPGAAKKIVVTFAVERIPDTWLAMIPEGGRLVAPVGPRGGDQRLVLVQRVHGQLVTSDHGAVRYVQNRSPGR
jgi:protein-L-isoaspartate(D-aspartate) O-methyltransferase